MAAAVERFSMGGDLISEDITSMKVAYEGSPSVVRAPKAEAASSTSSSTEESKTPSDAAEAGEPLSLATLVAEVGTMLKCGDDLALRARENIRAALKCVTRRLMGDRAPDRGPRTQRSATCAAPAARGSLARPRVVARVFVRGAGREKARGGGRGLGGVARVTCGFGRVWARVRAGASTSRSTTARAT